MSANGNPAGSGSWPGRKVFLKYRHYLIIALLLACIAIAIYINAVYGVEAVYTHFFYLPIILTAIWYYRKAVYLAVSLSLLHIYLGIQATGAIVPSTIIRAAMFVVVAVVIGTLSGARAKLFDRVRTSEEELRSVFDGVSDAIFIHDVDGSIIEVNDRMLQMYGVEKNDARRLSIARDYSSPASPVESLAEIWKKVIAGEDQIFDWVARRPHDGSTFPVEVYLRKIRFRGEDLILATVRDITARKRTEKELQDARRRAEIYIDLLGHDINNLNQQGIGYIELALDSGKLDDESKSVLQRALDAMNSSSALIRNVRKIQQIQAEKHPHEIIDLGMLLADVAAEFSQVPGREVTVEYQPVSACCIDASVLIKEAFWNLVSNAVKHSTGAVKIWINLAQAEEEGKPCYRVAIEDNGPGIPDELKRKLFTRMVRGTTRTSGSGLGLFLVKALIEDAGGKVWVEDRVPGDYPKGSRFVVILPTHRTTV